MNAWHWFDIVLDNPDPESPARLWLERVAIRYHAMFGEGLCVSYTAETLDLGGAA